MTETELALLVLAGPFGAALVLGSCPPVRRVGRLAALVSLAGVGLSLWAAVRLAAELWQTGAQALAEGSGLTRQVSLTLPWLSQTGPEPLATVGV